MIILLEQRNKRMQKKDSLIINRAVIMKNTNKKIRIKNQS